jgi:hypothetical protein
VLLSQGSTGLFYPALNYNVGNARPFSIASADFDVDGNYDIVVSDMSSMSSTANKVAVMQGLASGSFNFPAYFSSPYGPWTVIKADFNLDGLMDLATADQSSSNISVLINCKAVGMATHEPGEAKIYPNPATETFTIELNSEEDHLLEMQDAMGRIVLAKNIKGKSALNVHQFDNGIYFLQIRNSHGTISGKLIISR